MNRITIQETENKYTFSDIDIGRFFTLVDETGFFIKANNSKALSCYLVNNTWELVGVTPDTYVIRYDADITLTLTKDD